MTSILHCLFVAIAPVSYRMCPNKAKLDMNHNQLQHNLTFATEVCYSYTRHFLLGTFYSYKTARTCIQPRSVERRLYFAVGVMTATEKWKHPLPLKIVFRAVSNGYCVLEMAYT